MESRLRYALVVRRPGRPPLPFLVVPQRANAAQASRDVRRRCRLQHAYRPPILHSPEFLARVQVVVPEIQAHALAKQLRTGEAS